MNILFAMGHPAHYHLFKNVSTNLKSNGHNIFFAITPKDILENLLKSNNEEYYILANRVKKENLGRKFIKIVYSSRKLIAIAKEAEVNLIIGCLSQIAYAGKFLNIPSIFVGEDDFSITWMQGIITYPLISNILSPESTDVGLFSYKKQSYNGYNELAYLHPKNFVPSKQIVEKFLPIDQPYFIIRFAKLTAHHDAGIKGISNELALKVIDLLRPHGRLYITSERPLSKRFESFRLNIDPSEIHHVMAFAQVYIGDSQTMAAEAGILGVPFIRFNDFVGRIGYLRELEDKYELGYGIRPSEPEILIQRLEELLNMENRQEVFQNRRKKMLRDKIDLAQFMTWFVDEYPHSVRIMKENPDYQYRFKSADCPDYTN